MAKSLGLDANILIRAVLGTRAAQHIRSYAPTVVFLTVEEAFADAATYLPEVLARRGLDETATQAALQKLDALRRVIQVIPTELLAHLEPIARERLRGRDEDDWPYLALALLLDRPLWMEAARGRVLELWPQLVPRLGDQKRTEMALNIVPQLAQDGHVPQAH